MRERSRARELLPNVLLTLLSVVQALALEALWSALGDRDWLWEGGVLAWAGWLQAFAIFQGIIVIWLLYIGVVMRFSWVPRTRDSVAPFVLGAGELGMISMMGPELLPGWFLLLAAVFVFAARTSNEMFVAGLAEPDNRHLPGVLRDGPLERWASFIAAGLLVAAGALVWATEAVAVWIAALLLANALLLGQGLLLQHYWRTWVADVLAADAARTTPSED